MKPPAALVWFWGSLLALLGLTVALAYQPLGAFNTVAALVIAGIKVLIIGAVFMELRECRPLIVTFAMAGLMWLFIFFWLGSVDFVTRPDFPPREPSIGGGAV